MTNLPLAESAVRLSILALDVANESSPEGAGQRIVELATKLIPCVAADIVQVDARGIAHAIASSEPAVSLRTLQAWPPQSPTPPTAMIDSADPANRPPSQFVRQLEFDSEGLCEMVFGLTIGRVDYGFLRFILRPDIDETSADKCLASAFASHAALALDRAAAMSKIKTLMVALDTSREIGAAIGILMAQRLLDYDNAFRLLQSNSQNGNRKLRDVAGDVVNTGELPAIQVKRVKIHAA